MPVDRVAAFKKDVLERDETPFDVSLRPTDLGDFAGQPRLKERLEILVEAATQRSDPLAHLLFIGPPGLGKTSLAHILSKAMGMRNTWPF